MKICGNRSPDDVAYAVDADPSADAVGAVVESPESPRNLDHDTARDVLAAAPETVGGVAVTVATEADRLGRVVDAVDPDVLQLHDGAEPTVRSDLQAAYPDLAIWVATDPAEGPPEGPADAVVVDARTPTGYGGTGREVDWDEARALRQALHPTPVILAGGLTPDNVAAAVEAVGPAGVDVASGVETDGRKDPALVRAFIENAHRSETHP